MKKLKQIPVPVAIIIMVVCIIVGVAFGNHNAFSDAKAAPEAILTEVSAMASDRANKASNLLVVANRNDVDQKNITALEDAIGDLKNATRANKIAEANQSVTFAANTVNEQIQQAAGAEDRKWATGAMDEISSLNKQIVRRASAYNESVSDLRSLYNKLPLRWFVGGMPEVYQ